MTANCYIRILYFTYFTLGTLRVQRDEDRVCFVEDVDEDDDIGDDDDDEKPRVGARPQRQSNVKTKVEPMPEASSLFIFSSTNPYDSIFNAILFSICIVTTRAESDDAAAILLLCFNFVSCPEANEFL